MFAQSWHWLAALGRGDAALAVGCLIAVAVFHVFRPISPQIRRTVCLAALILGLAVVPCRVRLPVVRSEMLRSQWTLGEWTPSQWTLGEVDEGVPVANLVSPIDDGGDGPGKDGHLGRSVESAYDAPAPRDATLVAAHFGGNGAAHSTRAFSNSLPTPNWLVSCLLCAWAVGVVLLAVLFVRRYRRFGDYVRCLPSAPVALCDEWSEALAELGIQNVEATVKRTRGCGPLLYRSLRQGYCLLLDEDEWRRLSPAARRMVLRHEAAHVFRGDVWWSIATRAVALVHWYNPLAWWLIGWAEEYAEWACDEHACRDSGDRASFANALLAIADRGIGASAPSTVQPAARRRGLRCAFDACYINIKWRIQG